MLRHTVMRGVQDRKRSRAICVLVVEVMNLVSEAPESSNDSSQDSTTVGADQAWHVLEQEHTRLKLFYGSQELLEQSVPGVLMVASAG